MMCETKCLDCKKCTNKDILDSDEEMNCIRFVPSLQFFIFLLLIFVLLLAAGIVAAVGGNTVRWIVPYSFFIFSVWSLKD